MRLQAEHLPAPEMRGFADARALPLWPKVGAAWMPQGRQAEVLTPGKKETHALAGALRLETGQVLPCVGPRKNHGVFRDLLTLLDQTSPAPGGQTPLCRGGELRYAYSPRSQQVVSRSSALGVAWG